MNLGIYLRTVSSAREVPNSRAVTSFVSSLAQIRAGVRFNFAAGIFEELLRVFGIRKLIRLGALQHTKFRRGVSTDYRFDGGRSRREIASRRIAKMTVNRG